MFQGLSILFLYETEFFTSPSPILFPFFEFMGEGERGGEGIHDNMQCIRIFYLLYSKANGILSGTQK